MTCDTLLESALRLPADDRIPLTHSALHSRKQPAEIEAEADKADLSRHEIWSARPGKEYYYHYLNSNDGRWKWIKYNADADLHWYQVDWNGLPTEHPVPFTFADLHELRGLLSMPISRLLPPHRGPRDGPRKAVDFSDMGARGREA